MRPARWILAVMLALSIGLSACSGASGGPDESSAPTTTAPGAPGAPAPCDFRGGTFKRDSTIGADAALVQTADVSQDGCVDRIEFRFGSVVNLPPKYVVEYQPGPFHDFNQLYEIDVGGEAYLVIRFDQTSATDAEGGLVYESRESITPSDLQHLQELRQVIAPEGSVMFVAGLDSERPFVVDGSASPPRVIVTIG